MHQLTLFFILLCSSVLSAQSSSHFNSWEVSASFAPAWSREVAISGARPEISPLQEPFLDRRLIDSINVLGTVRAFGNRGTAMLTATDTDFWFGGSLRLHRRWGDKFDVAIGATYSRAAYTTRAKDDTELLSGQRVVNTRVIAVLYPINTIREQRGGFTLTGNYHLFAKKRIHPYFGVGTLLLLQERKGRKRSRRYTGDGSEIIPTDPLGDLFRQQYTFDFDFLFTAGVLYRISDSWSAGLDFTSRDSGYGHGITGLQFRHRLGK